MILEFIDIKDVYYPYYDVIKDYLSRENADIKDYKCERKNQASPIVIKWKTDIDSVVTQKFIYSLEPDFKKCIQIKVDADKREVGLFNLFKASTYYCKLIINDKYEIKSSFKTTDLGPRIINVDGIFNVRDVGGYIGYKGKRTKQGLLYRSGALTICADQHFDNIVQITSKGKKTLSKELKIKTEFDIRKEEEALFLKKSLIPNAKLIYLPTDGYLSAFIESERYRDVFKALAVKEYYPICMHCTGGADRTGTVCFILNALLGVCESDLIHDYEITTFSIYGIRDSKERGSLLQFCEFYEYFRTHYQGETLREKANDYLLSIGVLKEEIKSIINIMSGE